MKKKKKKKRNGYREFHHSGILTQACECFKIMCILVCNEDSHDVNRIEPLESNTCKLQIKVKNNLGVHAVNMITITYLGDGHLATEHGMAC